MMQSTFSAPALSPLNGKPILVKFDGAQMILQAGLTLLRQVERRTDLITLLAWCLTDPRAAGKVRHLLKLAATIVETKTRIIMTPSASCPRQHLIRLLFDPLAPPRQNPTALF